MAKLDRQTLIEKLELIPHPEGGFFREMYRSGAIPMKSKGETDFGGKTFDFGERGKRNILTSIYWMLTSESPTGWWIKNKSDHVHYHHAGETVTYYVIDTNGHLSTFKLGQNVKNGEVLQLVVPGGFWKASNISNEADYALIGEAVAPGFDSKDFEIGTEIMFKKEFPEIFNEIKHLIHPTIGKSFESFY